MGGGADFLTAVYRDSRLHIGGKRCPAGAFAAQLLRQYYRGDTAAQGSGCQSSWLLRHLLAGQKSGADKR